MSLILLVPHSPWTWHGGTHEVWRFPVPTLTSSVLTVPCSPQTWHCGTQGMWRSPGSVTFMLGLALHHPGDMDVHLLSISTFTSRPLSATSTMDQQGHVLDC